MANLLEKHAYLQKKPDIFILEYKYRTEDGTVSKLFIHVRNISVQMTHFD
jgi:UDP-glucose 4-epimerase